MRASLALFNEAIGELGGGSGKGALENFRELGMASAIQPCSLLESHMLRPRFTHLATYAQC